METIDQQRDEFLRYLARTYQLSGSQTRVFLARWAYNNREKINQSVANQLNLDPTTLGKHSSAIYKKFARTDDSDRGCANLEGGKGNKGKFELLFEWIWNEQFPKWQQQQHPSTIATPSPIQAIAPQSDSLEPEPPDGWVPLGSDFYVERSPLETECYTQIAQPNALIRIKAPQQMGKTSLMRRILSRSVTIGCHQAYLDLEEPETAVLESLDKLLYWFCYKVGQQIGLPNELSQRWDRDLLSSTSNCTDYFESYLLRRIEDPLAIGLDAIDKLFSYPRITQDFSSMLRSWHEKGKISPQWNQVRFVLAYSTEEDYIPVSIHQSPFNVGHCVEPSELTAKQVLELARSHKLDWNESQVKQLMSMVGGHPYLVRLALYSLHREATTLEQLLGDAPTEAGIYETHLRRHRELLDRDRELQQAWQKVVSASQPVELDSRQSYKLYSMGLVQRQGNRVMPRCDLYRQYFRRSRPL